MDKLKKMKKILILGLILMFITSLCGQINYDTLYQTSAHDENKNTFGVSLHSGYYKMKADVEGNGLGYGVRFSAPVDATFLLRLNLFRSTAKGLSDQPWTHVSLGGGLQGEEYTSYQNILDGWFPSYKFSQTTFELEGLCNVNRIISKQLDIDFDMVDLYILGGFGIFTHNVIADVLDENSTPYSDLIKRTGWNFDTFNSKEGRNKILENLGQIYDGNYETKISTPDRKVTYSYGAGFRLNAFPKFNIGAEYKIITYNNFDHGDGLILKNQFYSDTSNDSATYFNLFLEYKF